MEPQLSDCKLIQDHLDSVSRSFAFCIARLDEPYRRWVGLSYLVLRILDTVEDTIWKDEKTQRLQFEKFQEFCFTHPTESSWLAWFNTFPQSILESEKKLLLDGLLILNMWRELPEKVGTNIQSTVVEMSRGMQLFRWRDKNHNSVKLKDIIEVDSYCYYVAGIVGRLLLMFYCEQHKEYSLQEKHIEDSLRFGKCLQKINILKDQAEDELNSRFFVPERQALLRSLLDDLEPAYRFATKVLSQDIALKRFCCWSLFLGTISLEYMVLKPNGVSKLSREGTSLLLEDLEVILTDEKLLRQKWEYSKVWLNLMV